MTVVVTRPEPDAGVFADACRDKGLDAVVSPLMRVRFRNRVSLPTSLHGLAFTSANGVRAFAAASTLRDVPVFCVGEASAAVAEEHGFADVTGSGGDVGALAATIASAAGLTGPVIHIAGSERAGDLLSLLQERGVAAERIVAYDADAVDALPPLAVEALRRGAADVALFSPRTARLFVQLVDRAGLTPALRRCRAVCLSQAVADHAANARWGAVAVAQARNAGAMIDLLMRRA